MSDAFELYTTLFHPTNLEVTFSRPHQSYLHICGSFTINITISTCALFLRCPCEAHHNTNNPPARNTMPSIYIPTPVPMTENGVVALRLAAELFFEPEAAAVFEADVEAVPE
jgi:hypothetical protein